MDRGFDLSAAFSLLEANKESLGILDYSISQCTLEQIFLDFAKEQEEETNGNTDGAKETNAAGVGE